MTFWVGHSLQLRAILGRGLEAPLSIAGVGAPPSRRGSRLCPLPPLTYASSREAALGRASDSGRFLPGGRLVGKT